MRTLRKVWEAWRRLGKITADFIGRVVLTVFYFTIFVPFALGARLLSDPLALNKASLRCWQARRTTDIVLEDGRRQF